MELSLTFEESEVQKTVSAFARKEILPLARDIEKSGGMEGRLLARFKDLGILRLPFPERYGGVDASFTALMLAIRELGYASPIPPNMVLENYILAWPLLHYGAEALKDAVLPGLIGLDTIGGLAFTEPDTGSDPRQLVTVAQKTEGGWILNGVKRFITHSGTCHHMILFAKTEDGRVAAFFVETARPGYKVGRRETFVHMALDNGDLYLENYVAPDEHLLGTVDQGFEILLKAESLGKVGFCATFLGVAHRAVDLAISYANTRTHRGKPIGQKFHMIQEKIARMGAKLSSLNAHFLSVCAAADKGADIFWDAAALKYMTADAIRSIAADAMEVHGAYSLSCDYEISRVWAAAAAVPVVMGSLDIQKVIVAQPLLMAGKIRL